jgi:hypothetical protein
MQKTKEGEVFLQEEPRRIFAYEDGLDCQATPRETEIICALTVRSEQ